MFIDFVSTKASHIVLLPPLVERDRRVDVDLYEIEVGGAVFVMEIVLLYAILLQRYSLRASIHCSDYTIITDDALPQSLVCHCVSQSNRQPD